MKLRHLFTCALASVMVFMACEQEKDLGTPNVTLSTGEIILPQAGGDTTLTIIATRDWSVKLDEAADWLVVDPNSGSASASEQTVMLSSQSFHSPRQRMRWLLRLQSILSTSSLTSTGP